MVRELGGALAPAGDTHTLDSLTIDLTRDVDARTRIGSAARKLYDEYCALGNTTAALVVLRFCVDG